MLQVLRTSAVRSRRRRAPGATTGGYSLIETLVALALLSTAGLVLMNTAWQLPRLVERSEAKAADLRALESTLEMVRAGLIPPVSGVVPAAPGTSGVRLRSGISLPIVLELDADPTELPEVVALDLRATYHLRGRATTTTLSTRVWISVETGATP